MENRFKNFLGSTTLKLLVLVVFVGGVVFFIKTNNAESEQVHIVGEHTVEQAVLLSGSVRAVGQVELSFDAVGKVATTAVSQGDVVSEGQMLAALDYKILAADLLQAQGKVQSAQSSVSLAHASVQKAEANLSLVQAQNRGTDSSVTAAENVLKNTISEQETLVKNAYSDLLNNDLTAYPVGNHRNVSAPVVSGNYTGEDTGEYVLDFYRSGGSIGYSVLTSGLTNKTVSFDDYGIPAPLGDDGLYLALPASAENESYGNTDWVIPVPNTRSVTYQSKLGAYNKALQTQSSAISKAQSNLDTLRAQQETASNIGITTAQEQQAIAAVQEARANLQQAQSALAQAQAGVAKVQAQIENNIIRAPFDGTIARLDYVVGQSVGVGQTGITVVTDGDYELVMNIPEIDIAKVKVGDTADIILDTYGTDVVWKGTLTEIELVETKIDGVPSYASIITVAKPDERIKIGMNARARIVVDKKVGMIAVPSSYISTKNNMSTVLVKKNERQKEERVIQTGLVGTDYFVEVTDGLTRGETLVAPKGK